MKVAPITVRDIEDFHGLLAEECDATLTITFRGLGTSIVYEGEVETEEDRHRVFGKLKFIPCDLEKNGRSLPDAPPICVELSLDDVDGITMERRDTSATLRWGSETLAMKLSVWCDAP